MPNVAGSSPVIHPIKKKLKIILDIFGKTVYILVLFFDIVRSFKFVSGGLRLSHTRLIR